jgi:hypothetical protein
MNLLSDFKNLESQKIDVLNAIGFISTNHLLIPQLYAWFLDLNLHA